MGGHETIMQRLQDELGESGPGAELCLSHRLVRPESCLRSAVQLSIVLGEEMCGDGGGQWTITCTPPSTGL